MVVVVVLKCLSIEQTQHIESLCLSLFLSSHVSLVRAFHFILVLLTAYIGNASKKKCPGKASCKGFTSSSFGSTWVPRVEAEFRRPDVSSCRDVMSSYLSMCRSSSSGLVPEAVPWCSMMFHNCVCCVNMFIYIYIHILVFDGFAKLQ